MDHLAGESPAEMQKFGGEQQHNCDRSTKIHSSVAAGTSMENSATAAAGAGSSSSTNTVAAAGQTTKAGIPVSAIAAARLKRQQMKLASQERAARMREIASARRRSALEAAAAAAAAATATTGTDSYNDKAIAEGLVMKGDDAQSPEGRKGNAGPVVSEVPQTRAADATTDEDAAASTTADSDGEPFIPTGVLIGHRILRSYGESTGGCIVLRTPYSGAEMEVPSALFMGTVVAYRPPKAYEELKLKMAEAAEHEGDNGIDNEGHEDDNRTKKKKTCQTAKKRKRGRPKKDAAQPLDYALYRVQFDDGDVADMEPREVFRYSRLYDAKREELLDMVRWGHGLPNDPRIVGKDHDKPKQPASLAAGTRELRRHCNPRIDSTCVDSLRALDVEMQGYWMQYRFHHIRQGIPRPERLVSPSLCPPLAKIGFGEELENDKTRPACGSSASAGGSLPLLRKSPKNPRHHTEPEPQLKKRTASCDGPGSEDFANERPHAQEQALAASRQVREDISIVSDDEVARSSIEEACSVSPTRVEVPPHVSPEHASPESPRFTASNDRTAVAKDDVNSPIHDSATPTLGENPARTPEPIAGEASSGEDGETAETKEVIFHGDFNKQTETCGVSLADIFNGKRHGFEKRLSDHHRRMKKPNCPGRARFPVLPLARNTLASSSSALGDQKGEEASTTKDAHPSDLLANQTSCPITPSPSTIRDQFGNVNDADQTSGPITPSPSTFRDQFGNVNDVTMSGDLDEYRGIDADVASPIEKEEEKAPQEDRSDLTAEELARLGGKSEQEKDEAKGDDGIHPSEETREKNGRNTPRPLKPSEDEVEARIFSPPRQLHEIGDKTGSLDISQHSAMNAFASMMRPPSPLSHPGDAEEYLKEPLAYEPKADVAGDAQPSPEAESWAAGVVREELGRGSTTPEHDFSILSRTYDVGPGSGRGETDIHVILSAVVIPPSTEEIVSSRVSNHVTAHADGGLPVLSPFVKQSQDSISRWKSPDFRYKSVVSNDRISSLPNIPHIADCLATRYGLNGLWSARVDLVLSAEGGGQVRWPGNPAIDTYRALSVMVGLPSDGCRLERDAKESIVAFQAGGVVEISEGCLRGKRGVVKSVMDDRLMVTVLENGRETDKLLRCSDVRELSEKDIIKSLLQVPGGDGTSSSRPSRSPRSPRVAATHDETLDLDVLVDHSHGDEFLADMDHMLSDELHEIDAMHAAMHMLSGDGSSGHSFVPTSESRNTLKASPRSRPAAVSRRKPARKPKRKGRPRKIDTRDSASVPDSEAERKSKGRKRKSKANLEPQIRKKRAVKRISDDDDSVDDIKTVGKKGRKTKAATSTAKNRRRGRPPKRKSPTTTSKLCGSRPQSRKEQVKVKRSLTKPQHRALQMPGKVSDDSEQDEPPLITKRRRRTPRTPLSIERQEIVRIKIDKLIEKREKAAEANPLASSSWPRATGRSAKGDVSVETWGKLAYLGVIELRSLLRELGYNGRGPKVQLLKDMSAAYERLERGVPAGQPESQQ